jgi:hypothetical protein
MAANFEDALLLLADISHLLSLVVLLWKLRWFTGGDDEGDRRAAADVSLNSQMGLAVAHGVRWMDLFRKPKRSLEPVAKWAQKLPNWKKLRPKHLVALHKAELAYGAIFKVFCLSGMLAVMFVLLMRRWSFPSLSSRDPVPLYFLVALAAAGAAGIHSLVLMEPVLKPYEVAKTASFLLEVLAIFPQLIVDRTAELPPAPATPTGADDTTDEPESEVGAGDRVEIHGIQARPQLNGMFGTVTGPSASGERLNVKLENIEEETVALKPGSLKKVASQAKPDAAGSGDPASAAEPDAGPADEPARSAGTTLHYALRALARGIPLLLWWYSSFHSGGAQQGGMKVLVQKIAGAAASMLYLQVCLGTKQRLMMAPIVVAAVGFGVMQAQSQGLIPANRQLMSAATAAVPQMLQAEAVTVIFLIIAGGQPVLTSFYMVILPMLIKAGMMESPFDPAHVRLPPPTCLPAPRCPRSRKPSHTHGMNSCARSRLNPAPRSLLGDAGRWRLCPNSDADGCFPLACSGR